MPSKKKVHMEGNLPYRGGGGSTKTLVKFKKKVGNYYQGRGGPKQYFLFPFPKKTMGNNKDHKSSWIQNPRKKVKIP